MMTGQPKHRSHRANGATRPECDAGPRELSEPRARPDLQVARFPAALIVRPKEDEAALVSDWWNGFSKLSRWLFVVGAGRGAPTRTKTSRYTRRCAPAASVLVRG